MAGAVSNGAALSDFWFDYQDAGEGEKEEEEEEEEERVGRWTPWFLLRG